MNNKSKNNESLYENSMQVVINIMKLSSFPLTKMMSPQTPETSSFPSKNLRTTASKDTKSPSPTPTPTANPTPPLPKNLIKLQKMEKPVTYLLEPPVEGDNSICVVHNEEESVDGMASKYIRKVYEKIHYGSNDHQMSNYSAYMQSSRGHRRSPVVT